MTYDYQAPPESYFPTTMQENDDLHRCMEASPHVVAFWNAVCAFIDHEREHGEHGENPDRVLECPSWGQWRSIGQHLVVGSADGRAVKLLRASTCAWTKLQPSIPFHIANERWRAFMAANALPAWDHRGGLTLSEAKSIVDTLDHVPHWFGRDTDRVFNPLHVTCAEAPESLGDLLREKLNVPYDFTVDPREDAEEPEHSVWVNVYEEDGMLCSHPTREGADAAASNGRIACINITYKKGEGL